MKIITRYFLISTFIWVLLFSTRLIVAYRNHELEKTPKTATITWAQLRSNNGGVNNKKGLNIVFAKILKNNVKVCLINIAGGSIFGVCTVVNLAANGYNLADVVIYALKQGMSQSMIISLLAPHSFELLGIWLTGAVGLILAKYVIRYAFKSIIPSYFEFRTIIYSSLAGIAIIVLAAWIEVYVTFNRLL